MIEEREIGSKVLLLAARPVHVCVIRVDFESSRALAFCFMYLTSMMKFRTERTCPVAPRKRNDKRDDVLCANEEPLTAVRDPPLVLDRAHTVINQFTFTKIVFTRARLE